jgi:nicotinamidase-related amidase
VIRKTRYDSFYGTFLENLLGFYGVKHLVVTSTAVNICVLHTAGRAPRQASFLYKATLVKTTENSAC